jgi:hypothetical protein
MDLDTAHAHEGKSRFDRALAVLVGAAAVLAAVLLWMQTDFGTRQERAQLRASRLSVGIAEQLSVSGLLTTFQGTSLRLSLVPAVEALGRALAAGDDPELFARENAVATALTEAQTRIVEVAQAMGDVPTETPGLDPHTKEVMASIERLVNATLEELEDIRRDTSSITGEQNREVDIAEKYGRRGDRTVFALALLALGAVLLGLAGVMGSSPPGRIALVAAAVGLLLSLG